MQPKSDAQLLREYADHGSEPAFTELVARHTNLVYSAALRQVDSSDTAAEIAQTIFIDLAQRAATLSSRLTQDASLAGWLCRSVRNISLNLRRNQYRQRTRERQAMEQHDPTPDTQLNWTQLRPVLDDAMAELSEPDYDALVLRFYQEQDLRTIGQTQGISDDTAQKRVARALEKLRELLGKRGIKSTAAALTVALSANAIQAAPPGLSATLSTAALTSAKITAATITTAVKTIAMTTLQKSLVVAAFALVAGTGIYEAQQTSALRTQLQILQQQQKPLADQNLQLQRERDDASNRLALLDAELAGLKKNQSELMKLRGQVNRLQSQTADPTAAAAADWLKKVNNLKQRMENTPGAKIPELQYLNEEDWLSAAKNKLETDTDYRRALATLRDEAENAFAGKMVKPALEKYAEANAGKFPTDLSQLQSYFGATVDDAILQRWQVAPAKTVSNVGVGDTIITQIAAVDDLLDSRMAIGSRGYGSTDFVTSENGHTLDPVFEAYGKAHNGNFNKFDPSMLLPYATTPEQQTALQRVIEQRKLKQ